MCLLGVRREVSSAYISTKCWRGCYSPTKKDVNIAVQIRIEAAASAGRRGAVILRRGVTRIPVSVAAVMMGPLHRGHHRYLLHYPDLADPACRCQFQSSVLPSYANNTGSLLISTAEINYFSRFPFFRSCRYLSIAPLGSPRRDLVDISTIIITRRTYYRSLLRPRRSRESRSSVLLRDRFEKEFIVSGNASYVGKAHMSLSSFPPEHDRLRITLGGGGGGIFVAKSDLRPKNIAVIFMVRRIFNFYIVSIIFKM